MSLIAQPNPIQNTEVGNPIKALFALQRGQIDGYNVREGGLDVVQGTTISNGDAAGRLDAKYVVMTAAGGSSAINNFSATHNLGRTPVGFEVVNLTWPVALYSNTQSTADEARVYFKGMILGSPNVVTVTARIW